MYINGILGLKEKYCIFYFKNTEFKCIFSLKKYLTSKYSELAWHSTKTCNRTETSCFLKSQATFFSLIAQNLLDLAE